MKIATGVEMLEIPAMIRGAQTFIYPTLIWDSKTTILVDAGFPDQLSEFKQAIMEGGASFERIDKIIITHHDRDHIGSLRSILNELPRKAFCLAMKERDNTSKGVSHLSKPPWPMLPTAPILQR